MGPCVSVRGAPFDDSTLMRLLGASELPPGWHFDAKRVRGLFNVAADGVLRWGSRLCPPKPSLRLS